MALKQKFEALFKEFAFERPARRRSLDELIEGLKSSQVKLKERFAKAPGTDKNRAALRHIVAIERWGQNRLKVVLGEPLLDDANHDYKPPQETPWEDLQRQFAETREQTLEVANKLVEAQIDKTKTVQHNQFGPFSVGGWLRYLQVHASLESKRIR